ncbi:uncharacterized protein TM35_000331120 [Trypanosoma theileri]|uniref:Uncharacterized protein n=1 Tax=Trypanosoma theileri TaxID=67003 RepID=A0A1X0NLR8_9TRYP|nr:uncharacterized protein TM35_000331120 [Trypanosoma theileri]ORC85655.1 hypothetical protein TM35_000331120 [Trypanosoma theileri]
MQNPPTTHCRSVRQVLHVLQKKYQWLERDARVFFLAGKWQQDLLNWITTRSDGREKNSGARYKTSQNVSKKVLGNWVHINDKISSKANFLKQVVGIQESDTPPDPLFYVFADANQSAPFQIHNVHNNLCTLPMTTSEAASYIRQQVRGAKSTDSTALSIYNEPRVITSIIQNKVHNYPSLDASYAPLLDRHSADLLAVDFALELPFENPSRYLNEIVEVRQGAFDAVTLSSHLLKPSGTLLLRLPSYVKGGNNCIIRALLHHMRWGFQVSVCEFSGDHIYCMGCRIATEHPISQVRGDRFPGYFKKFERRPKKWNPRTTNAQGYFASQMPSFTNAPLVKEPLCHAIKEEMEATKKDEEKANKFFNLSVSMVERGLYHSKRDD